MDPEISSQKEASSISRQDALFLNVELLEELMRIASVFSARERAIAEKIMDSEETTEDFSFGKYLTNYARSQFRQVLPDAAYKLIHQSENLGAEVLGKTRRKKKDLRLLGNLTRELRKKADTWIEKFIPVANNKLFNDLDFELYSTEIPQNHAGTFLSALESEEAMSALASVFSIASIDTLTAIETPTADDAKTKSEQKLHPEIEELLLNKGKRAIFYHKLAAGYYDRINALLKITQFSSEKLDSLTLEFDDVQLVSSDQMLVCPPEGITVVIHFPLTADFIVKSHARVQEKKKTLKTKEIQLGTFAPRYHVQPGSVLVLNISPMNTMEIFNEPNASLKLSRLINKMIAPYRATAENIEGNIFAFVDIAYCRSEEEANEHPLRHLYNLPSDIGEHAPSQEYVRKEWAVPENRKKPHKQLLTRTQLVDLTTAALKDLSNTTLLSVHEVHADEVDKLKVNMYDLAVYAEIDEDFPELVCSLDGKKKATYRPMDPSGDEDNDMLSA